jgi:hypothetical protein
MKRKPELKANLAKGMDKLIPKNPNISDVLLEVV